MEEPYLVFAPLDIIIPQLPPLRQAINSLLPPFDKLKSIVHPL